MTEAHNDSRVVEVTERFMEFASDGMLYLLAQTLYNDYVDASVNRLVNTADVPEDIRPTALAMSEAATAISRMTGEGRQRRRAAVIEAIAERLVRDRPALRQSPGLVTTEQCIGPLADPPYANGLCTPVDIVVRGRTLEVLECKSNVGKIERRDASKLSDIRQLAEADLPVIENAPKVIVAFVTLMAADLLRARLSSFPGLGPIHAFTFEDFVTLADQMATTRVA